VLDLGGLSLAVAQHGRVARVVIAAVAGSAPREAGASVLVWHSGQSGTIGGGALEWQAVQAARAMLGAGGAHVDRLSLGPMLGQCCGGAVVLVTEVFDAHALAGLNSDDGLAARRIDGDAPMPLAMRRAVARARDRGFVQGLLWQEGWLAEPLAIAQRPLWIWGAGHVGRALVGVLAPVPDLAITWIDTAEDRFPALVPDGVTCHLAADPGTLVATAPREADHLIVTFSHALDLELCHLLLGHGFGGCGLIGSASKWARFRGRLAGLGHAPERVAQIRCPIGDPALGKHPQAIAIGVAAELMVPRRASAWKERA
jgi:xanthine dehydrogenase accessory factor